jgi:DNA-binding NtrC family response regulator
MRLASTDLPVLITGETGTGKEIFARLIHQNSRVKRGPFVPFNCSTVPRDLVESQLFGHRRGAFTGASESFSGLIRSAEKGTLFLDEVGDLDLSAQPKLLRFLENSEIQPLGELRPQRVGVRLVAATNANLEVLAREGRFRQDLLYRLGVAVLVLPPLRERKDEIPALASFFLARSAAECGRAGVRLADDFVAALLLYDWPGNIRELSNEIRRVVALADDGEMLGARHLAPAIARLWQGRTEGATTNSVDAPGVHVRLDQTLAQAVSELEERFIAHALETTGGRIAEAAQLLGLSRKGLFLKRRRRGLVPSHEQTDAAEG